MIVLPRGGIESSPRTTTAMIAVRGSPTSRTAAPAIAWSWATTKSRRSSGLDSPTSIGASWVGGAAESSPSRAATRSRVVPWRIADTTTTKKTALKMVFAVSTSRREHERGEDDRNGAAQAGPAEQELLARVEVVECGRQEDRDGPDQQHEQQRKREPRGRDVRKLAGEDEQAEHDEHRDLGEEREALVEADELPAVARRRAADREADEVHGEEAAAAEDVGGAERDAGGCERRDRRERADGAGKAREDPRRREREDDSDHEAEPELADDEQDEIAEPFGVGALDPGDQPERERDRHRVVAAGLGLERAREPAPDLGEAQRREDRRRVGGRDDRAEQERLEPRQVEERVRRDAGEERRDDDPDRAEQRRRARRRCGAAATTSAGRPRRG